MKRYNLFRFLVCCSALAVAAGCSDEERLYSTEVAFQSGDGTYVCDAAGGKSNISFLSRCGHWEIEMPDESAGWLEAWPLFGDDNGKTTLTVQPLASAYARTATLPITTARGVVGEIVVRQQGAEPYIRFDLLSDRVRADYQGTPITLNITSNLRWSAEAIPAKGETRVEWLTFGERTDNSLELLFADNTGQPRRECTLRFRMEEGDYSVDLPVTQRAGNNVYEQATVVTVADLLSGVRLDAEGSYEIEDNLAVEAWVTSDLKAGNLPDSVLYVQDRSGRGLKLLLKDKAEFLAPPAERTGWYDCGSKLSLHVSGLEFREDAEGNLAIYDFPSSVVMRKIEEDAGDLAVSLSGFDRLGDYPATLVRVDPVEFVFTYGRYTNFWEAAAQSMDKVAALWATDVSSAYKAAYPAYNLYPQLLRDRTGRVAKLWFSNGIADRVTRAVSAGKGALTGIVTRYRGEAALQMRNGADDAVRTDGERLSTTLLRGGPWRDNSNTAAGFEVGGGDATSLVFSLKNSYLKNDAVSPQLKADGTNNLTGGMYWLDAAIRHDASKKWSKDDPDRYLSLSAVNWWSATGSSLSNTADAGEGFILRTDALRNATGELWLSFSTTSSLGGPGWMKVQCAVTEATDLTKVKFEDVATYDAPVLNYTPYLMPYCVRLPDDLRGKRNAVILFRCASRENGRRIGADVAATGTNRLGSIEIVEIK
ncbi:DUF5689 domain-containing protein [Alistipes sp.]|uniref:DUF5689 domain-containing protein n=1 Tax=Alistipes sp. TaxID=1872444 RepID=UPI003AF009FD